MHNDVWRQFRRRRCLAWLRGTDTVGLRRRGCRLCASCFCDVSLEEIGRGDISLSVHAGVFPDQSCMRRREGRILGEPCQLANMQPPWPLQMPSFPYMRNIWVNVSPFSETVCLFWSVRSKVKIEKSFKNPCFNLLLSAESEWPLRILLLWAALTGNRSCILSVTSKGVRGVSEEKVMGSDRTRFKGDRGPLTLLSNLPSALSYYIAPRRSFHHELLSPFLSVSSLIITFTFPCI